MKKTFAIALIASTLAVMGATASYAGKKGTPSGGGWLNNGLVLGAVAFHKAQ